MNGIEWTLNTKYIKIPSWPDRHVLARTFFLANLEVRDDSKQSEVI